MIAAKTKRGVVVTTAHRGVFFGFLSGPDDGKIVTLTEAQMCVRWAEETQGVVGLSVTGPSKNAKVTRPSSRIVLQDVTAVMDVTDEAVKAWQERPWR